MTELKKQLSQLPENERLIIVQELIQSLSETNLNHFFLDFVSNTFSGKVKETFLQWLIKTDKEPSVKGNMVSGEEMKSWIRQQIAESENQYAEQMKNGAVQTFTLAELKAQFNG